MIDLNDPLAVKHTSQANRKARFRRIELRPLAASGGPGPRPSGEQVQTKRAAADSLKP